MDRVRPCPWTAARIIGADLSLPRSLLRESEKGGSTAGPQRRTQCRPEGSGWLVTSVAMKRLRSLKALCCRALGIGDVCTTQCTDVERTHMGTRPAPAGIAVSKRERSEEHTSE